MTAAIREQGARDFVGNFRHCRIINLLSTAPFSSAVPGGWSPVHGAVPSRGAQARAHTEFTTRQGTPPAHARQYKSLGKNGGIKNPTCITHRGIRMPSLIIVIQLYYTLRVLQEKANKDGRKPCNTNTLFELWRNVHTNRQRPDNGQNNGQTTARTTARNIAQDVCFQVVSECRNKATTAIKSARQRPENQENNV